MKEDDMIKEKLFSSQNGLLAESYFSIIKLIYTLSLMVYFISNSSRDIKEVVLKIFLMSCMIFVTSFLEVTRYKYKALFLGEIVIFAIILKLLGNSFFIILPVLLLDGVVCFKLNIKWYLVPYIGILFYKDNWIIYAIVASFTIIIYFQQYYVIKRYRQVLKSYEEEEYNLKQSIDDNDKIFNNQIKEKSLYYENRMFEEKNRIYQQLHDKLGHTINGSIYQLEASKAIIDKDKDKSIGMIENVMNALRESMDDIRKIIRNQKPQKKEMALVQLSSLCDECKGKYGIDAILNVCGKNLDVNEDIWDVLLDNVFEAVTNALKYSGCTKIEIDIHLLNEVVRCSVKDNGRGAEKVEYGMGIQGMKNRIRKVNGMISIESELGFTVNMIIPTIVRGDIIGKN